jgi:hypothetical protein
MPSTSRVPEDTANGSASLYAGAPAGMTIDSAPEKSSGTGLPPSTATLAAPIRSGSAPSSLVSRMRMRSPRAPTRIV